MQNEFGKKIKNKRLHLNLSLKKVCDAVKNDDSKSISVSYLNDIEQGYRNPPGGKIIVQLAEKLELNSQDLLGLAGKVDPLIEETVNKKPEMALLYRRLAELPEDSDIIQKLNKELEKGNEKK